MLFEKMTQGRAVEITKSTFAVGATLLLISILGLVSLFLAPHAATPKELALAAEILLPRSSFLQPKPETRFVYGAFIIGLPLVALVSARAARRAGLDDSVSLLDVILFAGLLAGALLIFLGDPLLPSATPSAAAFAVAPLGGILLALLCRKLPWLVTRRARIGTTIALCVAVTFLVFALRVFGLADASAESPHLSAYLYSINQIHLGGTCLADVVTQYGCYGELYRPIFAAIPLNLGNLTLVNAALQSVALAAVFVFTALLVSNSLNLIAAAAWVTLFVLRIDPAFFDVYYQYTPLRFVFPALSLLAAAWWCHGPSPFKATALGFFSTVAVVSNLDSGAVVAIALGALMLLTGARGELKKSAGNVLAYVLGLGMSALLIKEWLSYRSGTPIDLSLLGLYAKIFAGSGFMMLPTPVRPSTWMLAALTATASAAVYGRRVVDGEASTRDHLFAYVAILGIGLFSYYLGRSHPYVLVLCIWPLMIAAIAMLDTVASSNGRWGRVVALLSLSVSGFLVLSACMIAAHMAPDLAESAAARWSRMTGVHPSSPVNEDLAFIKKTVSGAERYEVLAQHQAVLYAELGKRSDLPGPGVAEILLKKDAEDLIKALLQRGPEHLFIGRELVDNQPVLMNTSPWLARAIPDLREKYALSAWSGDSRLMHLVRKPFGGNDFFGFRPNCASLLVPQADVVCYVGDASTRTMMGADRREVSWPFDIAEVAPAGSFMAGAVIVPDASQQAYATIMSSHCCGFQGWVIHALPEQQNQYVLAAGDGAQWKTSPPFHLQAGQANHVVVNYRNQQLTVQVEGRDVVAMQVEIAPSSVGLTVGDWFARSRRFSGRIDEAWYQDH